jgi:hypothetical protein
VADCGITIRGQLDAYTKPPSKCARVTLMIETAKLDRLLTQVDCRITSIARLRHARAISDRKAEQELKKAVKFRAELMRQIDSQNFAFDA